MSKAIKSITKLPYILLFTFLVIYFFPIIFQNQVFYYGDILLWFILKKYIFNSIASGVFPLWLPNINSGYPLFADISAGTYYLPSFILFFDTCMKAVSLLVVLHFIIAAFFMFKLGKLYRLSDTAALICGITFSLSGLMVNYIADPSRLFVVCLYPLFFYSFINMIESRNITWLIATSCVLSFQIFAGHIQYVLIELLFIPFFMWRKTDLTIRFRIFRLFAVVILATILSCIILLPSLQIIPLSTRSEIGQDISIHQNFSLNPLNLTRFFFANFWGIKNEGSAWGIKDTSTIGYIGFIPLVFILFNIKKLIRNVHAKLLLLCLCISLFISFGTYLPFFRLFIDVIPIFKIFRNPMAFLAIYTFSASLLAGFAADFFFKEKNKKKILIAAFFLMGLFGILTYFSIIFNRDIPHNIFVTLAQIIHKKLSVFHTNEVDYKIAEFISANLAIAGMFGFIIYLFRRKEILLVIVFLDLLIFTRSNFFTIEAKYLEKKSQAAIFLQNNLGNYRYLSSSEIVPYSGIYDYFGSLAFQPPFSKEGPHLSDEELKKKFLHELMLIPPNFSMYYGISTVDGLITYIFKDYNQYFKRQEQLNELYQSAGQYNPYIKDIRSDTSLTKIDFSRMSFNDEVLDKLAVKYIVTDRNLNLLHHRPVFQDGKISIYQNEKVKPRVILTDYAGNIIEEPEIIKEDANMIKIKVKNPGTLILRDIYYPGWKVFIDGRQMPIEKYEGLFRSTKVDQANQTIIFKFLPNAFVYGAVISVVSWVISVTYLIYFQRKRHA